VKGDTIIIGGVVAGEAAKARATLEAKIAVMNANVFDVAELLYAVKKGHYYDQPTFMEYIETLKIKPRKAAYLVRIQEVMDTIGCKRAQYEPIGVTKLREIASLDPVATYHNPLDEKDSPMRDWIWGLIEDAPTLSLDDVQHMVRILKGFIGENDLTWRNFRVTRTAAEQTIDPAITKALAKIGDVGQDADGNATAASKGRALEMICAEVNNDPNWEEL
jgi:hypothetical protein